MLSLDRPLIAILVATVAISPSTAQEANTKTPPADTKPAAKVDTVQRQPFVVRVKLQGVVEPTDAHEIRLVPDQWATWVVVRAVAHGTRVRKGEPIVWFDRRKLDQKLADLAAERGLTDLAFKQAEEQLALLSRAVPMDLAKSHRTAKIAREDVEHFAKIEKPSSVRNAEFSVESAQNFLEYQKEELKQLERMYKEDDLTDETEEIILKRARNSVKAAEHSVKKAKERYKETLEITLPRLEVSKAEALETAALALKSAEAGLPLTLSEAKLKLEKLKYDRTKASQELQRLVSDQKKMTIHAPADGIVYYGRFSDGKWTDAAAAEKMLRPGATVMPNAALMTVINPKSLVVRADVPQKDLGGFRIGDRAVVEVVGVKNAPLAARVKSIRTLADPSGKYSCVVQFDDDAKVAVRKLESESMLNAGMKCSVDVIAYAKREALVVPKKAVHPSPAWHNVFLVYRIGPNGEPEKVWVAQLKASADKAEVGEPTQPRSAYPWKIDRAEHPWNDQKPLKEGDKVLLEKPKEEAAKK